MKQLLANTIPGLLLGVWVALHLWVSGMIWTYSMSLANGNGFKAQPLQKYNEAAIVYVFAIVLIGMASSATWRQIDKAFKFDPHGLSADCISWCKKVLAKRTKG